MEHHFGIGEQEHPEREAYGKVKEKEHALSHLNVLYNTNDTQKYPCSFPIRFDPNTLFTGMS